MNSISTEKKTYRRIRKAIGWLGMGLPIVLVLLSLIPFFETRIQDSISSYYYTNFREIVTGTLCAVGLFLIRYDGTDNRKFWKNDKKLTNIAGVMALGVAFIPNNPESCDAKIYTLIPVCADIIGWIHYFSAGALFILMAVISINVFTIGQVDNEDIPKHFLNENNLYRICGYAMLVFILVIPVFGLLKLWKYSTLLFEGLALITFGISWLIKGRAFGDKRRIGRIMYHENNV